MPNDRRKVMPGKPKIGGCASRAPLGTALPANETVVLPAAYKPQGYLDAEGVSRSIKRAFSSLKAYGGDEVLNVRTEHSVAVKFNLLEVLNSEVQSTVWGSDVTVTPASSSAGTKIALAYSGEEQPESVWVFEFAYKSKVKRIVFPIAQIVTADFTENYKDDSLVSYPVELACYPDANGKYFYEYADDGLKTA